MPRSLPAREQRGKEQAEQNGNDGVEDDEEGVVADGAPEIRVAQEFGVILQPDIGRLAEARPVVEAVANGAEDRHQHEDHVDDQTGQDEQIRLPAAP